MRKVFLTSALLIGLLALLGGQALAYGHKKGGGHLKAYELLFNDQQNQQLEKLVAASHPKMGPLFKKLKSEKHALYTMLKNEAYGDTEIKTQVSKIADAQYALALEKAKFIRAVRKIATKEQLAKIDTLKEKHAEKHKKIKEAVSKAIHETQPGN